MNGAAVSGQRLVGSAAVIENPGLRDATRYGSSGGQAAQRSRRPTRAGSAVQDRRPARRASRRRATQRHRPAAARPARPMRRTSTATRPAAHAAPRSARPSAASARRQRQPVADARPARGRSADRRARRTMMQPPSVPGVSNAACREPARAVAPAHGIGPRRRRWRAAGRAGPPRERRRSSPQGRAVEADEAQPMRSGRVGRAMPRAARPRRAAPRHVPRSGPWHVAARTPDRRAAGRGQIAGPRWPDRSSQGWPAACQGRDQTRLGHRRAAAAAAAARRARVPPPCRRGRSAPLPRRATQRHRLGLVVAVMRQQQVEDRLGPASVQQQSHAGGARRRLDAGRGLGARPDAGSRRRCRAAAARPPPVRPRRRTPAAAHGRRSGQGPSRRVRAPIRRRAAPSAMLSGPPETATARRGAGSNGPSASSSAANSPASAVLAGSAAAGGGLLTAERLADRRGSVRVPLAELGEGLAGLVAVAHGRQRHAELEQIVRRPRRFLAVGPVVAGERRGGGG